MKRPFAFTGAASIAASLLLPVMGGFISAALLIAAIVIAFCFKPVDKRFLPRFLIVTVILLLVGIRFVCIDLYISDKGKRLLHTEADVEAIVTELTSFDNFDCFALSIKNSTEENAKGISVSGYSSEPLGFSLGDRIVAKVTFTENSNRYRFSEFNSGNYFSVELNDYYIAERSASPLLSFADKARKGILSAVNSLGADDEADLLSAVIIGDRHSVTVNLNDDVLATGTSHMLVVSGLHLGILCGLLMRYIRKRTNRKLLVAIMITFVIFITTVCLFHISILRAGICYIIMLIGMLRFKNCDPLNSLGFATTLLALVFPYIVYDIAFILSAAATFAVIGPSGTILDTFCFIYEGAPLKRRALWYIFETVTVSLCALVITLPITVYYFGASSLIAPISNLLLGFSVTGMLGVGIVGVMFWFLPSVGKILSIPFIYIAKLFAKHFLFMVKLISESGIGFLELSPDKSIYCLIFAVAFMSAVYFVCKKVNSKKEIKPFAYRKDPENLD